MSTTEPVADNGVNVQAPAGRAHRADRRPRGGRLHLARDDRVGPRHAHADHDRGLLGPGREPQPQVDLQLHRPTTRRCSPSEDNGPTPVEFVLVGPGHLPDRRRRRRRAEPQHPAQLGQGQHRGRHEHPRHPRRRSRGAQRLQRHPRPLRHRRRRRRRPTSRRSWRSRRSAPRCSTSSRTRRTSASRSTDRAARVDARPRRRHRGRPRRPRGQPRPHGPRRRARRARARRGRQHLEDRALGLAAAAHAELADAPAGPGVRRRRPGRLHDRRGAHPRSSSATPSTCDAPVRTADRGDLRRGRRLGLRRDDDRRQPGRRGAVVLATGAFNRPKVPAARGVAARTSSSRSRRSTTSGRTGCGPGRVLVVGASATGIQIADELLRSGREVTRRGRRARAHAADLPGPRHHVVARPHRPPRRALRRGRRPRPRPQRALAAARRHAGSRRPRPQRAHRRAAPSSSGASRRCATARALFSGSLRNVCNLADLKLDRLLDTIDAWAAEAGPRRRRTVARPEPTRVPDAPRLAIDLVADGYETVLWATGFRADYSWLDAAGARPQGRDAPRRRRRPRRARALPDRAATSCGAASRASSTAPRTTRPTSSTHLVAHLNARAGRQSRQSLSTLCSFAGGCASTPTSTSGRSRSSPPSRGGRSVPRVRVTGRRLVARGRRRGPLSPPRRAG